MASGICRRPQILDNPEFRRKEFLNLMEKFGLSDRCDLKLERAR